jgi:hypothetical protein
LRIWVLSNNEEVGLSRRTLISDMGKNIPKTIVRVCLPYSKLFRDCLILRYELKIIYAWFFIADIHQLVA